MAKQDGNSGNHMDMATWKPGSEAERAKEVAAKGDFGVPAGLDHTGSTQDRDYVSGNTRASDPGASGPAAWEHDGKRDHGAGTRDSGPGSGSGGDIDTDIIGVGTGGSTLAANGPDDRIGADEVKESATKGGGKNTAATPPRPIAEGSVVQRGEADGAARGADSAGNPAMQDDDSFRGEVTSGEGRGEDEEMEPSSD